MLNQLWKDILHFIQYADLWNWGLLFARMLDAGKYVIQSQKIWQLKTSKGHSRDFTNMAFGVDLYLFFYFIFKTWDIYMALTCLIMLFTTGYYWITVYFHYDYQTYPKNVIIKRPNIFVYFINSCIPDRIKKHL